MSSGPISPSPSLGSAPSATKARRSAFARLAAVYFTAFLACALAFAGGAYQIVRLKNQERVEALIEADREAILDKIGEGPAELRIGKATAIVLARSARPDGQRRYRLDQDDRRVVGDIPAGARFRSRGAGLIQTEVADVKGQSHQVFAQAVGLGGGATLYVGRAMDDQIDEVARIALLSLLLAALSAFVVGPWASRRILRQVQAINEACDRVRGGDFEARAPGETAGDEFGALARHINAMLERIGGLVSGLRDVSNRVAHDLRTPMARLKTDLESAARAETLEEARALAGAAAAETDEILQTFEALLDIAEAEAGSDEGLEPIFLDDAAQAAVDLYEAVAEDRGVRVRFEKTRTPILGERSLVMRLAANLIDNAIKFSPPDGEVCVVVRAEGDDAVLLVQDRGPGVPESERELVLRRFARGTGASQTRGYGLGLPLVAAVAKRHGADLRLEDAGPGLRVRVAFERFGAG